MYRIEGVNVGIFDLVKAPISQNYTHTHKKSTIDDRAFLKYFVRLFYLIS
jgi:hypothetical protein